MGPKGCENKGGQGIKFKITLLVTILKSKGSFTTKKLHFCEISTSVGQFQVFDWVQIGVW